MEKYNNIKLKKFFLIIYFQKIGVVFKKVVFILLMVICVISLIYLARTYSTAIAMQTRETYLIK